MDKLGMDLDDGSSSDNQENPQESLCQAFQAMLTMNQIQETMPPVQQGVHSMPVHQPQVVNAMNMQPPRPAGQMQHSQALQQLLQTLKSPNSPQQQQEVISILKTYPQLMAAFIKQRSQQLQQQQLQQQQHHQTPALQMPSMQQQPQQQPQNFTTQQEMLWRQRLQQQQQQQHHQNPALQMPSMQQQPQYQPQNFTTQQEMLWRQSLQQQQQQQPQVCCVGLSQFQAHGSVSQAQNSGPDMDPSTTRP